MIDRKIVLLRTKTVIQVKGRGSHTVFEASPREAQWACKITMTPAENFLLETAGETIFVPSSDVAHVRFAIEPEAGIGSPIALEHDAAQETAAVAATKRGPGRPPKATTTA